VEDPCSAPIRFGESEEEGPFRNWREERVGVAGSNRSDGGREGKTLGLFLRLEASHRLAQEGRFKEMRRVLNEMVEVEGIFFPLC
jgi:pentatricopeptide repeat protein